MDGQTEAFRVARKQLAEGWSRETPSALRWALYDDIHDALLERWPHEAAKISSMMVMWVTDIRGGRAMTGPGVQSAVRDRVPSRIEF